jgi:phage protein D
VRAHLNGVAVDSILHIDMTIAGSNRSSQFEITVSIEDRLQTERWLNPSTGKVAVTIFMHCQEYDSDTVIFQGLADGVAFDPINRVARVQGRDYSSVLISSGYQNSFCNQTASEIAGQIAQRHGFDQDIVATSAMVGSYQSSTYNKVLLNTHSRITSEWDILTQLATSEGFELFVSGTTLVFAPLASLQTNNWTISNDYVKSIKFHKVCPLSGQTSIVVKSWNSWLNQSLASTSQQSYSQVDSSTGGLNGDLATEVAIVKPNLTSQGAERLALRYSDQLNQQGLVVEFILPGNLSLAPRDIVTIDGNGAGFDADYLVKSVHWRYSSTGGFTQSVRGFATISNSATLAY